MALDSQIPLELIEMLRLRRVIPFIGAGFSAGHGLPDWDQLLRQVASELQDVPDYETIKRNCNGDNLQIAEYLFIKSDRNIGPLRHKVSALLQPRIDCLDSTSHVELVNLNAQQIYTTNYDEIIEQTFKSLNHPYAFVALPKHIAASNREKTQIIKYHGDLRYDQSLVLTESSYYKRLEFESPMDLKFRSDLLGQSVLFIGYSFRDINIRIIWFKLMEMMRDVPEADRPTSYIVRFERNDVLEVLYKAVGIRTIYLDPDGAAANQAARMQLLDRFLLNITTQLSGSGRMPVSSQPMYLSKGIVDFLRENLSAKKREKTHELPGETVRYIEQARFRNIHPALHADVDLLFSQIWRGHQRPGVNSGITRWAIEYIKSSSQQTPGACFVVIRGLLRHSFREAILEDSNSVPWEKIWGTILNESQADSILNILESELESHDDFPDDDLAYGAELAHRMVNGQLRHEGSTETRSSLAKFLKLAAGKYPAIDDLAPDPRAAPKVAAIIREIDAARGDDDIPF